MQGKDLSVAPADLVPAQRSLTARPSAQPAPDFLDAEYADVRLTNLRDYLRVVYKRRRLAAICFGVTVGLAVLYTVLVPRKYSASARLQVPRRPPIQLQLKDNVLNLEETDRVVAGASSFLETQVAALQSRDLADRVIRRLHLEKDEAFLETAPLGRALAWVLGMLLPQGGNTVAADSP